MTYYTTRAYIDRITTRRPLEAPESRWKLWSELNGMSEEELRTECWSSYTLCRCGVGGEYGHYYWELVERFPEFCWVTGEKL